VSAPRRMDTAFKLRQRERGTLRLKTARESFVTKERVRSAREYDAQTQRLIAITNMKDFEGRGFATR